MSASQYDKQHVQFAEVNSRLVGFLQRLGRGLVEGLQRISRGKNLLENLQKPFKISNFAGKFWQFSRGRNRNIIIKQEKKEKLNI